MNLQIETIQSECTQTEFSAYIDGELSPREEMDLELHLAKCKSCILKLNEQKNVLFALDSLAKEEKEFELPANFTKIIVANAESEVSGLRRPQERSKAFFVCAGLLLFALVGLGGETKIIFSTFGKIAEQFLIVVRFFSHLIYDIAVGMSVIFRSLSYQIVYNSIISILILTIFFLFSIFALSRLIVRQNRI